MKKLYYLIVIVLISGLVLTGCLLSNVGQVPTSGQSGIAYLTKHTVDDPLEIDLIADGGDSESPAFVVGDVLVWNDDTNLCVTYQLSENALNDGWFLTETHLEIVKDVADFPTTKNGNPKPGRFTYGDDKLALYNADGDIVGGEEFYPECIPLSELEIESGDHVYIAAHAVVQNNTVPVEWEDNVAISWLTETAWGFGTRFTEQGNWAMYFNYTVQEGSAMGTFIRYRSGTTVWESIFYENGSFIIHQWTSLPLPVMHTIFKPLSIFPSYPGGNYWTTPFVYVPGNYVELSGDDGQLSDFLDVLPESYWVMQE